MITTDKDFIFFEAPHNVAEPMNAVWSKARGTHRVPNTLGALRDLHKAGFDVMKIGLLKSAERDLLLQEKLKQANEIDSRLRDYQAEDVNFLMQQDHLASFSEMRTGKTPTLCQVIQKRSVPTIIVCPASLVNVWVKEVSEWTEASAETVGKATPKARSKVYDRFKAKEFNVLIISKGIAHADNAELITLGAEMIVVDEAHFLRNYKTAQSSSVYRLSESMKYRYALTGTPATNNPDDVYGILKFLQPNRYPSYWQFVERYFVVADGAFGKAVGEFKSPNRKKEFYEVIEEISVQRKRVDVMAWLPPKQYQTIELEMGKKQRKAYDQMKETFEVEDTYISAPSVLAQLTRLRQLTLAPSMLELEIPSAKEEFILEWLQDNPNEQVVIFSNFTSYLKKLTFKIQGHVGIIIGDSTTEARARTVENFQNGSTRVLLANIQAAGTGLTLDAAGVVIFLDRDYTPSSNEQAEDRIVATTQESNQSSLIIDLVCKKSIDEKILKMVKEKKNITEIVNNYRAFKEVLG